MLDSSSATPKVLFGFEATRKQVMPLRKFLEVQGLLITKSACDEML
jgi:hypothetical protein